MDLYFLVLKAEQQNFCLSRSVLAVLRRRIMTRTSLPSGFQTMTLASWERKTQQEVTVDSSLIGISIQDSS